MSTPKTMKFPIDTLSSDRHRNAKVDASNDIALHSLTKIECKHLIDEHYKHYAVLFTFDDEHILNGTQLLLTSEFLETRERERDYQ